MEGQKSTDKWFPVVLIDDDDFLTAKTGVAFGDVTCKYSAEGASALTTYTVTTAEWKEAGEGMYWLLIGASEFTVIGKYEVAVAVTDAVTYRFMVEVKTNTADEFQDGTLTEPAAGLPPATPTLKQVLNYIYRYLLKDKNTFNKGTGVETNYKNDGSTARFKRTITDDGTTTTKGAGVAP